MAKVLIVDDDDAIRTLLDEMLNQEGFHVRTARHGKEALDLLQHEEGWVVLLDVNMPVLDSFAVIEQVRTNPAWLDDHRVVLMSAGRTLAGVHLPTIHDVVLAIVPKPFELDTLLQCRLSFQPRAERRWLQRHLYAACGSSLARVQLAAGTGRLRQAGAACVSARLCYPRRRVPRATSHESAMT